MSIICGFSVTGVFHSHGIPAAASWSVISDRRCADTEIDSRLALSAEHYRAGTNQTKLFERSPVFEQSAYRSTHHHCSVSSQWKDRTVSHEFSLSTAKHVMLQ